MKRTARLLKNHWPWICVVALALLFGARAFVNPLPPLPEGFYDAPLPQAPQSVVAPAQQASPIPKPPEPGSVTVLADGEPIVTLASADEAAAILEERLIRASAAEHEGETPVRAEFTRLMELRFAVHGEAVLPVEQARRLLNETPSLCPVRLVTRRYESESVPYDTAQTEDKRLPLGNRMVLQTGREGLSLTVQERHYSDGSLTNEQTDTMEIAPLEEKISLGSYEAEKPAEEPGRNEGEKGKEAPFALTSPVNGGIVSNFGMRNDVMHYGLDYECGLGDEVKAMADGVVCFARARGSYGFLLEIDHGGGFVTRLSPLKECTLAVGDSVAAGQVVGLLAAPFDEDDDPHLHMELLIDGIPYNPRQYLS